MIIESNPPKEQWEDLLRRPQTTVDDLEQTVDDIFDQIQQRGDQAVRKYTELFDGVQLDDLSVDEEAIRSAENNLSNELRSAIDLAYDNIKTFHQAQKRNGISVETMPGIECKMEVRPIERVGLYIPGGTAPLFSSVLMLAIPAQLAGCHEIVLCTPPNQEKKVHPAMLYAAKKCGVDKIFKLGGIQAVGAMTFGTESVPKVYKILGPGNRFVTAAKQRATKYGVSIDMPAGPSELMLAIDDSANASYVAADALSQAEHGVDSQIVIVSKNKDLLEKVDREIQQQIQELPRKDIAQKAIENSVLIVLEKQQAILDLINAYAPEHLIIATRFNEYLEENIINAGSVFIGNLAAESIGDYASGTNHTLPTNGFARQYSGVNISSFQKSITFQKIDQQGLQNIGKAVEQMAEAEDLLAHKKAVSMRLKDLDNNG
ncbi:MAG: histidinol dehydrogenase [Psychroflexus sp.]|nr:histidinol dehydrogenase [Psychroflexus sp.]